MLESSNRIVVLIGTSHKYQLPLENVESNGSPNFYNIIDELSKLHQVKSIAEEMSVDALQESGFTISIAQKLCDDRRLLHQFTDPTREERKKMGILQDYEVESKGWWFGWSRERIEAEKKKNSRIRERFWLSRIDEVNIWPLFFICGANHFNSFATLLLKEGVGVVKTFSDWESGDKNIQ